MNISQFSEDIETIDLRRYLLLLWRYLWLLLLALVLGSSVAFFLSRYQTPIYEARTQVMVARPTSQQSMTDLTQALNTQQLTQTYVELLSQDWIRNEVARRVGGEIKKSQVAIKMATNTPLIYITVEDPDPLRAKQIADTFVEVLIEQNAEIQAGRYNEAEANLNVQIEEMEKKLADVQQQLNAAKAAAYQKRLEEAWRDVENTRANVQSLQIEIQRLKNLRSSWNAKLLLDKAQKEKEQLLKLLTEQSQQYTQLQSETSDPSSYADPIAWEMLYGEMLKLGDTIEKEKQRVDELDREIKWLTPLIEPDGIARAIADRETQLAQQQTLLVSYQEVYNRLLVSNKSDVTNDEVVNLEKSLSMYQQIYLGLLSSRETVRLQRMQNMPNVVQVVSAIPSEEPVRPNIWLNTVLGGVSTLGLTIFFIFLREALDVSIRSRDDVEQRLGVPVLGGIGFIEKDGMDTPGPYVEHEPRSPIAEAFRMLRTNLEFSGIDRPLRVVLVTSVSPSEGKTTVAANLAAIFAQGGKQTVLIDADLRRPSIHRLFGVSNRKGLSELFLHGLSVQQVLRSWDGNEKLHLITSGSLPPNPAELLASERMKQILNELGAIADLVVIDAPPMLVSDTQILASRCDGVLIVAEPGRSRMDALAAAVEQLKRVNARLLGIIFNRLPKHEASYWGNYRYRDYNYHYYREYHGRNESSGG